MEHNNLIEIVKNLLAKLSVEYSEVSVSEVAGHTIVAIQSKDSGALIGANGETLHALNHVVRKILEGKVRGADPRSAEEEFRFVVDVNGYHLRHIKGLEEQAHLAAEKVRTFKHDVEMSPMSSYDRMIVHASLKDAPGIKTGSEGEGPLRHVVVKYAA